MFDQIERMTGKISPSTWPRVTWFCMRAKKCKQLDAGASNTRHNWSHSYSRCGGIVTCRLQLYSGALVRRVRSSFTLYGRCHQRSKLLIYLDEGRRVRMVSRSLSCLGRLEFILSPFTVAIFSFRRTAIPPILIAWKSWPLHIILCYVPLWRHGLLKIPLQPTPFWHLWSRFSMVYLLLHPILRRTRMLLYSER